MPETIAVKSRARPDNANVKRAYRIVKGVEDEFRASVSAAEDPWGDAGAVLCMVSIGFSC